MTRGARLWPVAAVLAPMLGLPLLAPSYSLATTILIFAIVLYLRGGIWGGLTCVAALARGSRG